MEKKSSMNLITAFNWVVRKLDSADIPASQQLALFHILARINANFFKPTPISINKLAAQMCVSKRTAKAALNALVDSKLIKETEGGYTLAFGNENYKKSDSTVDERAIGRPTESWAGYVNNSAPTVENETRRNVVELFKGLFSQST